MKGIKIFASVVCIGFIIYQIYLHINNRANSSLVIDSLYRNNKEIAILYINNRRLDTINLQKHYPYMENIDLSWGKNDIVIRSIQNKSISYKTSIYYFGLYSWNVVQYRMGKFLLKKYYIKPKIR